MISKTTIPNWEPFRPIGNVMDATIPHVSAGLAAGALAELLARDGASRALVVDGDGKPTGIVLREDVRPAGTANLYMRPITMVLHASVPISVAAALIADSDVGAIAVIGDDRRAAGVLTWRELAAWVAREAGHRAPIHPNGGPP